MLADAIENQHHNSLTRSTESANLRHKSALPIVSCHVWHILKILQKSVHLFFCNFANIYTDPENRKKSCTYRVKCNIPKMFQIVHSVISDQCWKFHENPFICFSEMSLTDTDAIWWHRIAWWHQAIIWLTRFCHIHLRAISKRVLKLLFCIMHFMNANQISTIKICAYLQEML